MPDHIERLLDALEGSTRTTTEVIGEVRVLKEDLGHRMSEVESELGTMNAHLDNLVREAQITNQLLRDDMEDRKKEAEVRQQVEAEEREWRRQLELRRLDRDEKVADDNRSMVKKVGEEAWLIIKQPLGYLIAGVIGWFLLHYAMMPPPGILPTGAP